LVLRCTASAAAAAPQVLKAHSRWPRSTNASAQPITISNSSHAPNRGSRRREKLRRCSDVGGRARRVRIGNRARDSRRRPESDKGEEIKALHKRLKVDFRSLSGRALRSFDDATLEASLTSLPSVGLKTARCVMLLWSAKFRPAQDATGDAIACRGRPHRRTVNNQ